MPRLRSLVHTELHRHLRRSFFARAVTIETFAAGAAAPSGYRPSTPTELPGHIAIPAAIEPLNTRGRSETRLESLTIAEGTHEMLLMGYFPEITTLMRARDDAGEVYDIAKVDHDSAQTLTRLQVRQVSPVAVEGQ